MPVENELNAFGDAILDFWSARDRFLRFMAQEHGLTLTFDEMDEILHEARVYMEATNQTNNPEPCQ